VGKDLFMKRNMGNIDRAIRVILGLAAILAGLCFQAWLGIVLLGTAAIGWYPLCVPLRPATCRVEEGGQRC
jgi:hypothetical protein